MDGWSADYLGFVDTTVEFHRKGNWTVLIGQLTTLEQEIIEFIRLEDLKEASQQVNRSSLRWATGPTFLIFSQTCDGANMIHRFRKKIQYWNVRMLLIRNVRKNLFSLAHETLKWKLFLQTKKIIHSCGVDLLALIHNLRSWIKTNFEKGSSFFFLAAPMK